jgi:hypothetical protein
LAGGIRGYSFYRLNPVFRLLSALGGMLMIYPELMVSLLGMLLILITLLPSISIYRKTKLES